MDEHSLLFQISTCRPTITAPDTIKFNYSWVSENGQWNCFRNVYWNNFQMHLKEG